MTHMYLVDEIALWDDPAHLSRFCYRNSQENNGVDLLVTYKNNQSKSESILYNFKVFTSLESLKPLEKLMISLNKFAK